MSILAELSWTQFGLMALMIGVCLMLIIVVLLQRGRGGGLSGAFGGGGGSSAFGAKTGDVFTWITVIVTGVFVLLAVIANFGFDESEEPVIPLPAVPAAETPIPFEVDSEGNLTPVGDSGIEIETTGQTGEGEGAGDGTDAAPPPVDSAAGEADQPGSAANPDTPDDAAPPTEKPDTP